MARPRNTNMPCVSQMRKDLSELHLTLPSWDKIGAIIGQSGGYAWKVAAGQIVPNAHTIAMWKAWKKAGRKPRPKRKAYHPPEWVALNEIRKRSGLTWRETWALAGDYLELKMYEVGRGVSYLPGDD